MNHLDGGVISESKYSKPKLVLFECIGSERTCCPHAQQKQSRSTKHKGKHLPYKFYISSIAPGTVVANYSPVLVH